MICNKVDEYIIGNTTLPLKPLIDNVISFIKTYLPLFPNALIQSGVDPKNKTEKLLNQSLIDFFNGHSSTFNQYLQYKFIQYKFLFRKDDEKEGTNYKPDIGVTIWRYNPGFSGELSFFQIECKRLSTSLKHKGKEYVKGHNENTGGIERFKNNKHGEHLNEAALIGFIQNGSLKNWYDKIMNWVQYEIDNTNSSWTTTDKLLVEYQKELLHKYSSVCNRVSGSSIVLHHFFIDVSKN